MVPSLDKIEVECYSGYRTAKEVAPFYIELDNREQAELVQGLRWSVLTTKKTLT
ncbi:MAG: hypothetical protein U9M96_04355 [Thermodesulfobacteriota bacterium]|nr:hypothetical protein [Thermodesulfobacteriota bacterium]